MTAAAHLPTPGITRPVVSVIDHLHRSRAVADAATEGRFHHIGVSLELGRRPDWVRGGLAADDEWRIEWVKLYEGLDLAAAFEATGAVEYLRTWEGLLEAFWQQVPIGYDTSDVTARRLQNWIYAEQRFAGAPAFVGYAAGFADRFRARVVHELAHLRDHLTAERNHRTLELYALLVGGYALDDDDMAGEALALLAANAGEDVWPDGVHRECSSDYHLIVVRSYLGAILNARATGNAVPELLTERVLAALRFGLQIQAPDGTTPALSDGDRGEFRELFALAAEVFDRDDLRWVATGGERGTPPAESGAVFPVGGYVVLRSGWGLDARSARMQRHAIFDCGPLGDGGHGHYDQLSVELAGGGRRIVVDPGRYTYTDVNGDWRRWFKGTAAHNTITVDGLDHVPYRQGKPKGPRSVATLETVVDHDGIEMVVAALASPRYTAHHRRTLFFVDGDFWIVHDALTDATVHRYDGWWHLDAPAWGQTELTREAEAAVVRLPAGTIAIAGADAVVTEAGWVSEHYGSKLPAPVVRATVTAADADLVTVIVPGPVARVSCRIERLDARENAVAATVSIDGRTLGLRWDSLAGTFSRRSVR